MEGDLIAVKESDERLGAEGFVLPIHHTRRDTGGIYTPAGGLPPARTLSVVGGGTLFIGGPIDRLELSNLNRITAGIDEAACRIEPLLEMVAADEEAGLGDAPWPPHYPKQPGEPPRVQPSKKVAENWDE